MSYNDRDHADVARANAEAEALQNDLNRFDEDEEPAYGDSTGITSDLELADVTEEQWIQARTDSLVLEEAIGRGLLDGDTATRLQVEIR